MISVNFTIAIQFVNFIIGLLIINYLIIKPLREVMAKRRASLGVLNTDARSFEAKAKSKLLNYEERLKAVKADIVAQRENMKAEALAKAHAMQTGAEEESRSIRQAAQESRVVEGEKAYAELSGQTKEYAQSFVNRLFTK